MDNIIKNAIDLMYRVMPSKTYTYDFTPNSQAHAASPDPTAAPTSAPISSPANQPPTSSPNVAQDLIKQNVAKLYGKDNPALNYLPQLLDAGKQLPQGVDPYLPLVIALRETQGGRYNVGQ